MMRELWDGLSRPARVGLVAGAVCIVGLFVAAGVWVLHGSDEVLFSDLKPQDTAMMVAELDRMKVPYRIGSDGNTILVDASVVHATRLKLMGKDLPLHGTAGFELFNNADFGMTEFAQKINYQRALQGELTRTILSLSEVRDARVHLALPEQGLFRREDSKAKAAVTLMLKPGQALGAEQVRGIQRLVAAAVPGIQPQDVTIVDEQGVALTRAAGEPAELTGASSRLDLKRETERLLMRKATDVLEHAFGAGQALATVDVTLDMDQVRVTTEDVIGAPARDGGRGAGVVVRERESTRDLSPPLANARGEGAGGSSQREVEYQVGKRVEQVASAPGAIRRVQVVAVVRQPLDATQIDQMRQLVAAAVGAVPDRGDTVVVQSLQAFRAPPAAAAAAAAAARSEASQPSPPVAALAQDREHASLSPLTVGVSIAIGVAAFLVAAAALWARARDAASRPRPMTLDERRKLLEDMRLWLQGAPVAPLPNANAHQGEF
jgi:flagellar M-ring protein FliF